MNIVYMSTKFNHLLNYEIKDYLREELARYCKVSFGPRINTVKSKKLRSEV